LKAVITEDPETRICEVADEKQFQKLKIMFDKYYNYDENIAEKEKREAPTCRSWTRR